MCQIQWHLTLRGPAEPMRARVFVTSDVLNVLQREAVKPKRGQSGEWGQTTKSLQSLTKKMGFH